MLRPFVPLLIAFMAGISCGSLFDTPDNTVQLCLAVTLLLILLGFREKRSHLFYPPLLLSLFLLGILEMNLCLHRHPGENHILHFITDEKITVEGMICENPQVSPDKTELIVSVSRILHNGHDQVVSGRVMLNIREPYPCGYGDIIRFKSRLRAPHNFQNPGSFDYESYLRFRGILVRGFVADPTGLIILRKDQGNVLRMRLEHFRDRIRKTILEKAPGPDGRIIQAMILGDQKEIPKEVMEKFNRTGTTHIIAISGFNVGIVAVFSLFVIQLLLKSSEYLLLRWDISKIATFFAMIIVVLYMFIAGLGISVVRASIMGMLFMIALLFNRGRDLYNALAFAAFLILLIAPYSLFDVSFQLTFAAVAAILFLTPRMVALLPPADAPFLTHEKANWLFPLFKKAVRGTLIFFFVSVSATLGTLPLILLYFNRLSLITLVANLAVVPVLGVIATPLFLLIIPAIPVSDLLTDGIMAISSMLVRVSLFLVEELSALPWASIYVTTPNLVEIAAFYLLLVSIGFCLDRWRYTAEAPPVARPSDRLWRWFAGLLILFFIIDGVQLHLRDINRERLILTAVDIGQGSSILIRFPGGQNMLVDGGGFYDDSFDVGRYVLAPYLWKERIDRIETVVLTHPHPDHLQGLLFILENFQVREVWTNGESADTPLYQTFLQAIRNRKIALRTLSDLTPEMEISGVLIRILSPHGSREMSGAPGATPETLEKISRSDPKKQSAAQIGRGELRPEETNDQSLVLKLTFGRRSFLLPGDIAEASENHLVQSSADLKSDVLFVPHHGGYRSSSPSFIEKVRPELAVISCGRENIFRVPHPDVLKRYERIKARIFRTDRDGAITLETDGTDLQSSVFRSVRP